MGICGAVQKPGTFLTSRDLSVAHVQRPSRNVYASNPNSYINHVRDNGSVDMYSVYRRNNIMEIWPIRRELRPKHDPDGH